MRTFVISLPERPERLAAFDARARAAGLDYELQPGIVPAELGVWRGSRGALGCALAHREILQRVQGEVLILEDDAAIDPDFVPRLERGRAALPEGWDMLLVGAAGLSYVEPWCPPVHRVDGWHQTHGYLVSSSGLEHVLAANEASIEHWDHELAARLARRRRTWVLVPTVQQDPELGSDVES